MSVHEAKAAVSVERPKLIEHSLELGALADRSSRVQTQLILGTDPSYFPAQN
jgi:hypothetical protein